MGGEHSDNGETFRREDWQEVEKGEVTNTWQNRRDPTQRIVEYRLHLASKEDCHRQEDVYYLRKNHPQLVAALYLCSQSNSDFCSSSYQQQLFLEKTPITLTDIEHIPYPDFLHLYSQSLKGFSELAQHFGHFTVEQDYIGINERAVAKVWVNADFSSHHVAGKVSQEDMVRSIVDIIERNIDHSQLPQRVPPVRNYLYRNNAKLLFAEAMAEFNNFVRQFSNGYVPQKLECIDRVGGIYAIANRDRSSQATTVQQNPVANQYPAHSGVVSQSQRPVFAESNVIASQFHQNAPRVQSSPTYFTNIPNISYQNDERSMLTPSTVRQNVPVVRKQTQVWFKNVPQQQTYEIIRNAPSFAIVQPPQPINIKVGSYANDPKIGQNIGNIPVSNNGIQNIVINQQQTVPNVAQSNIANTLYSQFTNEVRPIIKPNEPQLPDLQMFQQSQKGQVQPTFIPNQPTLPYPQSIQSNQQNINTFVPNPLPNQFNFPSQTNSTVNLNSNGPNSRVVSNQSIQQNPTSNECALNAFDAVRNEITPSITMPRDNLPSLEPFSPSFNFSKANQAQYAVDVNDGKSSLDFFKRLNEMATFSSNYQQAPQSFGKIDPPKQEYSNPFSQTESPSRQQQQQEFGRNAVSKIVSYQLSHQAAVERTSEPLKFQNNVQMKYSIFEQSAPAPTYTYKS